VVYTIICLQFVTFIVEPKNPMFLFLSADCAMESTVMESTVSRHHLMKPLHS